MYAMIVLLHKRRALDLYFDFLCKVYRGEEIYACRRGNLVSLEGMRTHLCDILDRLEDKYPNFKHDLMSPICHELRGYLSDKNQ
jgi:hypothetical protein